MSAIVKKIHEVRDDRKASMPDYQNVEKMISVNKNVKLITTILRV